MIRYYPKDTSVKSILTGDIVVNHATDATRRLTGICKNQLAKHMTHFDAPINDGEQHLLFQKLQLAKKSLAKINLLGIQKEIISALFPKQKNILIDKVRLRGIIPGSENNPNAKKAYYAHRDTWYGNDQSQINIWIPLHHITQENSFAFYPTYFKRKIANDSAGFNLQLFNRQIGFGNDSAIDYVYPSNSEEISGGHQKFKMNASDSLVFSSHHLHQTVPNMTKKVRRSLDFRAVCEDEETQVRNLDNKSIGNSKLHYDKISLD